MARIERRKTERIALEQQPKGRLTLRVGDQEYAVTQAQNVSNFGLNVVVATAIPEKSRVTIAYADEAMCLDVYGMVVWRATGAPGPASAADAGGFVLGIELFSPTLLTAFLGAR
jgi:hypothetical protein